jgi:flagellin-like protein
MNSDSKINNHLPKISFKVRRRRGVAEIIGTMMLMAITVVGASVLSYFVNNSFNSENVTSTTSIDITTNQIKLIAYDTRDSTTLMQLSGVDNKSGDQKLCGISCVGNVDKRPINGGTEFFVIQFTNNSINSIFLSNLQLNYVVHNWDSQTAGTALNLSSDLPIGSYPHGGKFSILKTSSSIQSATNEIKSGQTVNLLVKLAPTAQDISLSKTMNVVLNIGSFQPVEFIIESGDVI